MMACMWHVTINMCHMACVMWHLTCDTWHVSRDMWHVTHRRKWILSQHFRSPCSNSLGVKVWCFEDIWTKGCVAQFLWTAYISILWNAVCVSAVHEDLLLRQCRPTTAVAMGFCTKHIYHALNLLTKGCLQCTYANGKILVDNKISFEIRTILTKYGHRQYLLPCLQCCQTGQQI